MMRVLVLFTIGTPCLSYRVIDTLLPRNPPVGIDTSMRLRYLLLIHKGLPYPEMCHVRTHDLLRCLMRPHVFPQILHRLFLIPLARADARSRLGHSPSAHRRT